MTVLPLTATLAALKPYGPKQVNQHAAEAEYIVKQLCAELGIMLPHFDEFNTMSAYTFPEAGLRQLVAIGLYNNLLFYLDDVYDRHDDESEEGSGQLYETFVNAVKVFATGQKSLVTSDPILQTAYEIHCQFADLAYRNWFSRFQVSTMAHLQSRFRSPDDLVSRDKPLVERYKIIRDDDSGMEPALDMTEFALGFELSLDILKHPVIQEARQLVSRYGSLSNDLFSYEKEVMRYGSEFNIVPVLMSQGASFNEAVDEAIEMLNGIVDRYVELEAELPHTNDDTVNAHISDYYRGMSHHLLSAYYWQYDTPRYRAAQSPFVELRSTVPQLDHYPQSAYER